MTGRAVPGAIDDARLVEALRTGDVIALSEVYDTFAPSLFDYCHGLLRDRVEAAGALRHCLFSAREHVTGLREPRRLRGWLYAIARKESLRRREDPTRSTGQEAPETGADEMSRQERGRLLERRELAHAALGALDGRQREMLDLAIRHGLPAPDLAKIFGTAPDETEAALGEARAALANGLRAAMVARRHSRECPGLSALLPQSWPPAPPQARALGEHVASCRVCAAQPVPDLPSDQVLGYMPIAAVPADLRLDILNAAASPGRAEARRAAAALSEPLDPDGWPTPYSARRSKRGRRARANDARPPVPAAQPLAAPVADAAPGAGWESPSETTREDLAPAQNWNTEATAPDGGRPAPDGGRHAADVIGSGAPDTTLTFDVVPGDAAATGQAPAGGLAQGRGPAGGGGRHSRDASSGNGDGDDGDQLTPRRSGRIPEDGDRWVAGELRSERGRKRAMLAGVGGVAAVAVLGASVAAFAGGGGGGGSSAAKGGHTATPSPSETVVEPSMTGAASPSGSPTLHPKKGSASPTRTPSEKPSSPTTSPTAHTHAPPPPVPHSPPPSHTPRPGTLSVAGCSIGLGRSCEITVTATGGSVTWRVVGVSNGLSASGGGTLSPGQSATVHVRRESMCLGSRTGQVAFSPSGVAAVSFC
ncbi:sigma-70 family RNA polymerase sigma factor [Spirillospora sp. NPDC052269]